MKWLVAKSGSMARPSTPRSLALTLLLSVWIDTNGVASSAPFLKTRTRPVPPAPVPRSVMKSRPSGAKAIDVGNDRPDAIFALVKPDGSANAGEAATEPETSAASTQS
jgi:hypothetical protein